MSTVDRQRVTAVKTLVGLGFVFRDGAWHQPPATTVEPAEAEFLASLVQELRPPLHAIHILAQQLADNRDGNLLAKQVAFARTIHAASTDLAKLIDDVLDISRMRSGTVSLDVADVDIPTLMEQVARPFRDGAAARRIAFNVHVDVEGVIATDAGRLRQALSNLLANAFRFTTDGGVTLRAFATSDRGHISTHPSVSELITFEVSDNGIDIQPQIIFDAIQHRDFNSFTPKYRGLTLGLAIAREWAKLLGGDIEMHGVAGLGSRFALTLPTRYSGPRRQRGGQQAE